MNEVLSFINNRKSIYVFEERMPEKQVIESLFLAASRAPSGFNRQPWRFLLSRKGEADYENLLSVLNSSNARWASSSPILVLVMSIRETKERGSNFYAGYEAGMAVANLLIQAESVGLSVHQMGGYDKEKARKIFRIPEEYDLFTVMAIGYPDDPDYLPDDLKDKQMRRTTRLDLADLILTGPFN